MDKLTDKLNNISIHHAPTPKLLRSGKNRLENGNNKDDSGKEDSSRILIFATSDNIELLNSTNEWYFDGTFDVSPELFKQVVTINIIFRRKNLPLVYA